MEAPWLGHIISEGLVKVDPSKMEAIVNVPEPIGKADLFHLLGMTTYLDKFFNNLAVITRPLWDLLKEPSAWVWKETKKFKQTTKNKLKEVMFSLPSLRRFDFLLPVVLSVDASPMELVLSCKMTSRWIIHLRHLPRLNNATAKSRWRNWQYNSACHASVNM